MHPNNFRDFEFKNMESYSLLELNQCIRQQLKDSMPDFYWIVAEINELHINSGGHCFIELIEKSAEGGQIIAKARANIWAYNFKMLSPYFKTMTGQTLAAGLKIMLQASVDFHELYGLSLTVTDINPAYTVGDLAMQRMAVIQQLKDEGVFDMNRELNIPQLPQRIAVISSETAAGYGDFVNQLHNNPKGYDFHHTLFHATVQGNEAENSIIEALERIFDRENEFDVVALLRGGGSQSDLNCFNGYCLSACIAQFPLPVITGIGHERDETVADMVACIALKTPTAVAEFLINKAMAVDNMLQELTYQLEELSEFSVRQAADKLQHLSQRLLNITNSHVHILDKEINSLQLRLKNAANTMLLQKKQMITLLHAQVGKLAIASISNHKNQIVYLENKLHLLDPVNLLRRGYSITRAEGKVVSSAKMLKKGQLIETIMHDGKIESAVL